MRTLKAAITIAIIAGAAAAMAKYVVNPYSCNLRIRRATQQLEGIVAMIGSNVRAAEMASQDSNPAKTSRTNNPDEAPQQRVLPPANQPMGQTRELATPLQ